MFTFPVKITVLLVICLSTSAMTCIYCKTGKVVSCTQDIALSSDKMTYVETQGKCAKGCGMHEPIEIMQTCKRCKEQINHSKMRPDGSWYSISARSIQHFYCAKCSVDIPCASYHSCDCPATENCILVNCDHCKSLLCGPHDTHHSFCGFCKQSNICSSKHSCLLDQ